MPNGWGGGAESSLKVQQDGCFVYVCRYVCVCGCVWVGVGGGGVTNENQFENFDNAVSSASKSELSN